MGRLSTEIEADTAKFYADRSGFLINICDGSDEAHRQGQLVQAYCDKCGKCTAFTGAISLGEVRFSLRGSGLFAIGPLDMTINRDLCPLIMVSKKESGKQFP